jgi:hypothetical protein
VIGQILNRQTINHERKEFTGMATTKNDGRATRKAAAKAKAAVTTPVVDTKQIAIPEIEIRQAMLTIRGVSPLIVHRWSEKALKALEDSQTGKAKQKKGPRIPEEEWRAACYVIPGKEDAEDWKPGKYYFPASGLKHAYLYGIVMLGDPKSFPKSRATGWVFMNDDPTLAFESVTLRTDIGRNPTQPVYRPQFNGWSMELAVDYDAQSITLEQVVAIMDRGLYTGGIGEWRPSAPKNKTGSFGRARIESVRER